MLADGKSLDDKRNLLVDDELFMAFAFGDGFDKASQDQKLAVHEKFNLPQILDHFRYLKSDYWGKMHTAKGELLHINDVPHNLGFDQFLENTCTHDYSDRTSQSFLVPFQEIKDNDWDLSINRYKEIVYEEVVYDAPSVILKRIANLNKEREKITQKLKSIL